MERTSTARRVTFSEGPPSTLCISVCSTPSSARSDDKSWQTDGSTLERHEKVSVSKEIRMRLNGESERQMVHAETILRAGGVSPDPKYGEDTSVDQNWEYDLSLGGKFADFYVLTTTFLWLGVKLPLMALPMLLCTISPMLICELYVACIPESTERIQRSALFYSAFCLCFVSSLPAIVFITISLFLDYTVYYTFSFIFCALTWRWRGACRSHEKIRPYSNGPGVLLHLPDLFTCVLGQCTRQTVGETWYMVSTMWILIPWLKYYICCNPWIYDLDHRLCQQISTEMSDLGSPEDVAETARGLISRARQRSDVAERIDLWSFVPHYPNPPPTKRWAVGLQAGGGSYPGKFTLIVHTTHAKSEAGNSTEQLVLSRSCKQPIYRVMLWYSNPFHFLTGWVEASVSTGKPSQPAKDGGGEHPMWLVTGRTPLTAGRDSWTGSGMIDAFFDFWLPVFVHEMRRQTYSERDADDSDGEDKALSIANAKYQEVHSSDGISTGKAQIGRAKYGERDALSQFSRLGKRQGKDITRKLNEFRDQAAYTDLGKAIHGQQQGQEIELFDINKMSPESEDIQANLRW